MALIKCEDLAFAYSGETVLRGVSFSVNAGDYLCIVGENGSGKSTLMRGLLARALNATSKLLLLDEPVAGLDPVATGEMYNILKLINLCDGVTVVMVSHDVNAAMRYATHILQLGHTQLYFGSVHDYVHSDAARILRGGEKA